jgi:hypothetical protein
MSVWLLLKRREHPRSFLSERDKAAERAHVRKPPVRRPRAGKAPRRAR